MLELKAECVGGAASRSAVDFVLPASSIRYSGGKGIRISNELLEPKYVEQPGKRKNLPSLGSSLGRKLFAGQTLSSFEDSLRDLPDENEHWLLGHRFFSGTVNAAIVASAVHMGVIHQVDPEVEGLVKEILHGFEFFFAAIFTVEILVKLSILKHNFFCDHDTRGWNVMDFVIGAVSIIDCWVLPYVLEAEGSSALSIVRIFRLLRLLRILKFLRRIPELMMVMEGMFAAMKAMCWIVILLFGLVYILSIICVEIVGYAGAEVYPAFSKEQAAMDQDVVEEWNSYLYFGTLHRSLVSLFSMMLLAEWSQIVRPVFEKQTYMVVGFGCLIFVTTFGIFNVMIGVVVERTNEAMAREKMQNENERSLARVGLVKDLAHLMFQEDEDGNGKLSLEEMRGLASQKRFREFLDMIDLPFGFDVECLFMMFDDHGLDELSEEHFVLGMLRLLDGSHFQQGCIQQLMIARVRRCVLGVRGVIEESVCAEISALRAEITTLFVAFQCKTDAGEFTGEGVMSTTTEAGVEKISSAASFPRPIAVGALEACRPHAPLAEVGGASAGRGCERDLCMELRLAAGLRGASDGRAETVALQALWKRLGAIVEALEQPITQMAVLARETSRCRPGVPFDVPAPSAYRPGDDPVPSVGRRVAGVGLSPREAGEALACLMDVPAAQAPWASDPSPLDRPSPLHC